MKKAVCTFLFLAGITGASLQAQVSTDKPVPVKESDKTSEINVVKSPGSGFVDSNGDGICDNSQQGKRLGPNYTDNNKDGKCDNLGNKPGNQRGRNFVDANNDGICDHRGKAMNGRGQGRGYGKCRGNGQAVKNVAR